MPSDSALEGGWEDGRCSNVMKFLPHSVSGKRLRKYGVSSHALRKVSVLSFRWFPIAAFTVPIPFDSCIILVRRRILDRELDGALADGPSLAPLVHQYCHAHQRMEWGFVRYLWRHFWSRVAPKGIPVRERQVERECYGAARAVEEAHARSVEASVAEGSSQ